MVANSQCVHRSLDFTVHDIKMKIFKHSQTKVGGMGNPRYFWICAYPRNCVYKLGVITPTQSDLRLLIVGNLSGVLFGRCGV